MNSMTNDQHAAKALANALTRARKHLANGQTKAAARAMTRGVATAEQWLDGTHPKAG